MIIPIFRRPTGMTLIEMLLVIGLIAILSTLANRGWQQYQNRQRLEETSARLLIFLVQVQGAANWRNERYVIYPVWQDSAWCLIAAMNKSSPSGECHSDLGMSLRQPFADIKLIAPAQTLLEFHGRRNMALGGHLLLENAAGRVRVVLSSRGRLRRCSENHEQGATALVGISSC